MAQLVKAQQGIAAQQQQMAQQLQQLVRKGGGLDAETNGNAPPPETLPPSTSQEALAC